MKKTLFISFFIFIVAVTGFVAHDAFADHCPPGAQCLEGSDHGINAPNQLSVSASLDGNQNNVTISISGRNGWYSYLCLIEGAPNTTYRYYIPDSSFLGDIDRVRIVQVVSAPSGQMNAAQNIFVGNNFTNISETSGNPGFCNEGAEGGFGTRRTFDADKSFNVSNLANGTYVLRVEARNDIPGQGLFDWSDTKDVSFTVNHTTRTLTVSKVGQGTVTAPTGTGDGINCGSNCTEDYTDGTSVTMTPTPASGWTFSGWSGHSDCSNGNVTMSGNRNCTATFVRPACNDGVDNDGDGDIDYPDDGGCSNANDDDETGGTCVMTTQLKVNNSTGPVNATVGQSLNYDIDVVSDNGNCGGGNYRKQIDFDGNGSWDWTVTNASNGAATTHAFSLENTYVSKGRITALGPNPDVTANTNNVTVNVTESATVQCNPANQTIDEDTSTSFSASGGTGVFSWAVSPTSGVSPTTGGNSASFGPVTFANPGSFTATVTRGATQDSCSVSVSDICEVGGTVTINAEDSEGNPLETTWILSGPEEYTPGGATASWTDTVVVANPSSSYWLNSIENLSGYGVPSVAPNPIQAVTCGGSRTFTITYPVDTTPFIRVEPSTQSTTVGGTAAYTACYDSDGGGTADDCDLDVTDVSTWSVKVGSSVASYTGTPGEFEGGPSTGQATIQAVYGAGSCGFSAACSDGAVLNVSVGSALSCSPSSQNRYVDEVALLSASGGDGDYSWSAPGGTPSSGSGSTFDVFYSTSGSKTVTLSDASGGSDDQCTVEVSAPVCGNNICEVAGGEGCNADCPEDCNCDALTECSDGIDNDGDGDVDYPDDLECEDSNDDDEGGEPRFEEF